MHAQAQIAQYYRLMAAAYLAYCAAYVRAQAIAARQADHLGNVRVVHSDIKQPYTFGGKDFYADIIAFNNYYPFGMQQPGRTYSSDDYRYGFNGMEADNEIKGEGNSYTTFYRAYDSRLGRWWSLEPLQAKYPGYSPYSFSGDSPIWFNDPNGDDWFKDAEGNVQYLETSSVDGFSDLDGNSWENIGTELLEFNGETLTHYRQTGNEQDGFNVEVNTYNAVSGKPEEGPQLPSGEPLVFDYSVERQQTVNIGPTPEGLYSVRRSAFVEGENESGTELFSEISEVNKLKSMVTRGTWPGGINSWGSYRWKLKFENAERAENAGRADFYLHGGYAWGSRGCIDLGCAINSFYREFINNSVPDKVYLKVIYAPDLVIWVKQNPTYQPLQILYRNSQ